MGKAKVLNRQRVKARLARVPKRVKDALARQLSQEVNDLVAAQKRATPDDPSTPTAELRDSTHAYPNPSRPLSYRIVVDARDEKGAFIAPKVEHGHRNPDGSHTPPRPWFFPTYRARRRGMRRRMQSAARKVLKQLFPR